MKKSIMILTLAAGFILAACNGENKGGKGDSGEITPDSANQAVATAEPTADELGYDPALLKTGEPAPSFTLNDTDGKAVSLESQRGKVVVIDFWGTWCRWCIKGIPDMKAYYEKYKSQMEILSVDCGDGVDDWKDAVKEHGMIWTNVQDSDGKVAEAYGIQGFPTKIVLDKEGKILKVVVGEDPAFYTYLDKLFT